MFLTEEGEWGGDLGGAQRAARKIVTPFFNSNDARAVEKSKDNCRVYEKPPLPGWSRRECQGQGQVMALVSPELRKDRRRLGRHWTIKFLA